MKEKNKRKRGEKSWRLSLVLFVAIMLALAVFSFFIQGGFAPTNTFVTQAWNDPLLICPTYGYIYGMNNEAEEAEFQQSLSAIHPDLVFQDLFDMRSGCDTYSYLHFRFSITEAIDSDASLAGMLPDLIMLTRKHCFSYCIVSFTFENLENGQSRSWSILDTEAQRALDAGLRGADLWLIGQ